MNGLPPDPGGRALHQGQPIAHAGAALSRAHSGTYRRARIPKLATGVPAGAAAAIGGRPAGRTVQVMRDADCTAFLQWALPQLDLHWPGFRKVCAIKSAKG